MPFKYVSLLLEELCNRRDLSHPHQHVNNLWVVEGNKWIKHFHMPHIHLEVLTSLLFCVVSQETENINVSTWTGACLIFYVSHAYFMCLFKSKIDCECACVWWWGRKNDDSPTIVESSSCSRKVHYEIYESQSTAGSSRLFINEALNIHQKYIY
jgi:hypothetical protein